MSNTEDNLLHHVFIAAKRTEDGLTSTLSDRGVPLKQCALEQHTSTLSHLKTGRHRHKFSVSVLFWVFCLPVLAGCSDWFNVFPFLSTSVWPFYFYFPHIFPAFLTFRLCAWLSVFAPSRSQLLSLSSPCVLSLSLSPSLCLFPSFPLFIAVGANVTFMCCQLAAWPSIIICSH